ncbi:hypothetical protein [Egicoccus halophilus]|uniref:Uncharacterized protein n=1 Tax=Egicoccus halophilus TaxID=1670830 RepID=A0A8J3A965_9ACTN|nr:hypothetical protein [Egicoccus halophilus]GGI05100.1 hypothetical protein GCM10011354_12410 [Egicoccus halophilus]
MHGAMGQGPGTVAIACDGEGRRAVVAHRESVVRRLLASGLTPPTLAVLLPEWGPVVERVAAHRSRGADRA